MMSVIDDDKSKGFFTELVDQWVIMSEYDPELKDGLKWVDEQSKKTGLNFYDQIFEILYKQNINKKAKDWLNKRN